MNAVFRGRLLLRGDARFPSMALQLPQIVVVLFVGMVGQGDRPRPVMFSKSFSETGLQQEDQGNTHLKYKKLDSFELGGVENALEIKSYRWQVALCHADRNRRCSGGILRLETPPA